MNDNAAAIARGPARAEFGFDGGLREYWQMWMLAALLNVLSVTLYAPWSTVRRLRWFHRHTFLGGEHFDYQVQPLGMLFGRLFGLGVLAGAYALWRSDAALQPLALAIPAALAPFALAAATARRVRNTTWRNLCFGFDGSPLIGWLWLGWPALLAIGGATALAEGVQGAHVPALAHTALAQVAPGRLLLWLSSGSLLPWLPYLDYARVRYTVNHSFLGEQRAHFEGGLLAFYRLYTLSAAVITLLFSAFAFAMAAATGGSIFFGAARTPEDETLLAAVAVIAVPAFYLCVLCVRGYFRAARLNLVLGRTRLGERRLHARLRGTRVAALYLLHTLAALASAGLLLPWAEVRFARYLASCVSMDGAGPAVAPRDRASR